MALSGCQSSAPRLERQHEGGEVVGVDEAGAVEISIVGACFERQHECGEVIGINKAGAVKV